MSLMQKGVGELACILQPPVFVNGERGIPANQISGFQALTLHDGQSESHLSLSGLVRVIDRLFDRFS